MQAFPSGTICIHPVEICHETVINTALQGADEGTLVTSGGRVLGVTATADTLPEAIEAAYRLTEEIHFENAYCRRDIGKKALAAMEG